SESGAALAALEARDTVKSVRLASLAQDKQFVDHTLDRRTIFLAQTPQAFRRRVLRDALQITTDATDEAALAEAAGHPVRIVAGEASNIKITTPEDLAIAETIARSAKAFALRVGAGYDLHRLVEGRPLILGGIPIPFDKG